MTVQVFHNCPVAITNLTFDAPETSTYSGSQHSNNGNLENALAELKVYDNFMQMSFNVPINEEEDLVITTSGVPLDTPQAYENALNAAGKGDFKIINGVVKIKADNGTYVLTSDANVTSPTVLSRVKNLAAILTKGLGGNGKEIYINTEKGKRESSENPAWSRKTSSTTNTIFLNINGGLSSTMNNINNFKSILKHEMLHVENNRLGIASDLSNHADIYLVQMKDPDFKNTTLEFQLQIAKSFGNYLLNIDKRGLFSQNIILAKIEKFNIINQGIMYMQGPLLGNFALGTLNLSIKYKNYESQTIDYKYEEI